jgi:hypothetical protein
VSAASVRRFGIIAPLALALAAGGCGDEDGTSPLAPAQGIAGVWVRYRPDPMAADPVALTAGYADTLALESDGRGRWSRIMVLGFTGTAQRVDEGVMLVEKGPVLELRPIVAPCPACNTVDPLSFRAPYLLLRTSADRLVLRRNRTPDVVTFDGYEMVGGDVAYYERRASAARLEN